MSDNPKNAIIESFLQLLNCKPFNEITVKETMENCNIKRSCFYYYFKSTDDLFQYILDNEKKKAVGGFLTFRNWTAGFVSVIDFILLNKKIILNSYNYGCRMRIIDFVDFVTGEMLLRYSENVLKDYKISESMKYGILSFFKYALTGNLLQWIIVGMPNENSVFNDKVNSFFEDSIEEAFKKAESAEKQEV